MKLSRRLQDDLTRTGHGDVLGPVTVTATVDNDGVIHDPLCESGWSYRPRTVDITLDDIKCHCLRVSASRNCLGSTPLQGLFETQTGLDHTERVHDYLTNEPELGPEYLRSVRMWIDDAYTHYENGRGWFGAVVDMYETELAAHETLYMVKNRDWWARHRPDVFTGEQYLVRVGVTDLEYNQRPDAISLADAISDERLPAGPQVQVLVWPEGAVTQMREWVPRLESSTRTVAAGLSETVRVIGDVNHTADLDDLAAAVTTATS